MTQASAMLAPFQRLKFQATSRTHAGAVRAHNEDATLARSELGLWAVADGMGGHRQGEVASALAVQALEGVRAHSTGYHLLEDVRGRLGQVNLELIERAARNAPEGPIGATVVALVAFDEYFACLWAGDSRAYVFGKQKGLKRITRDHTLVEALQDGPSGSRTDRETPRLRGVVTRALGVAPILELDLADGAIFAGDVFLLCSDGLTNALSDEELANAMSCDNLDAAADKLLKIALERLAADNVSFVLIWVVAENDPTRPRQNGTC